MNHGVAAIGSAIPPPPVGGPATAYPGRGLAELPSLERATLPAEVRNGTVEDRRSYQAALGFERMLLAQLTQRLTSALEASSREDDRGSAVGAYGQMLSDTLADGVARGGGLGLAEDLYRSMRRQGP